MKKLKLVGTLSVIVLTVILILQNTQTVETRFLFFKFTMPNAALLGLTLLIGIGLGILIALATSGKRAE